jgi:uncharacterized membrane protein
VALSVQPATAGRVEIGEEHEMSSGAPGGRSGPVALAGVPLGIGLIGALDTIVFHKLLQWHTFYVDADEFWRIFSDGLLHAFTLSMLFFGAYRLWEDRRTLAQVAGDRLFWGSVLLGGGAFQLFDGVVNHKLLRLHPVREGASNVLLYDLAWIASAVLILMAGWLLWRSGQPPRAHVEPRPRRNRSPV